ncbi:MAG: hypothetical protein WBR18_13295 [Anaerolineales bacterium]
MDIGTLLLIAVGVLLLFLLLDLLFVGGAMSGMMMGGMVMAASTPIGAILLVIALVLVGMFGYLALYH